MVSDGERANLLSCPPSQLEEGEGGVASCRRSSTCDQNGAFVRGNSIGAHAKKLSLFFASLCVIDLFGVFPIVALPRSIILCGNLIFTRFLSVCVL